VVCWILHVLSWTTLMVQDMMRSGLLNPPRGSADYFRTIANRMLDQGTVPDNSSVSGYNAEWSA
jgi:hypothetical protein